MSSMKKRSTNKTHKTAAYKKRHAARMWRHVKRHGWWIGLLLLLAGAVVFQMLYPGDRTLPLARYNHEPYGFVPRSELATDEQVRFVATKIELQASYGSEEFELREAGAELRENATFATLRDYPDHMRWVPFSILFYRPNVTTLPVEFADEPLEAFVQAYVKEHTQGAVEASIAIQDGEVVVVDGKRGRSIDGETLQAAIRSARTDTSGKVRVSVPEEGVQPSARAADLATVRSQAEAMLAKKIYVTVPGRDAVFEPERETIASWLRVVQQDGAPVIELDGEALHSYTESVNSQVAQPAGVTQVVVTDGAETSRQEGAAGEQINRGDFEQKMSSALLEPGQYKYVTAVMEPLAPRVNATYHYSHSQAGLQAKMNDIGKRYDVRISLQQLGGNGWQATYRGGESTPSASTYKLYVALRLFKEMNDGKTNWQSSILDTNVENCFEQMIAVSTNQCAEEWIRQFGRANINEFIYAQGISHATTFVADGAIRTSADDLVRTVIGINNGSLASGNEREKLLNTMSRQIWRKGIPTGTAGWAANKVGFLWDYVHDTAIVHHPQGVYAIAIMTKGASYDIIAQITRELEAQMYP